MIIRPEAEEDHPAVRSILEGAFGRPAEADLVEALRADAAFMPELSLVAERNGAVLGHILFSVVSLQEQPLEAGLLALAPLAVLPEAQRQGIGCELTRAGLDRASALGFRGVVVLGHPAYYPRFGFVPASRFGIGTTYDVPDEVYMALPLREGALEGLTGTILYPPAFEAV